MKNKFGLFAAAAMTLAGFAATTNKAEAAFIAYICDDAACTGGGDTIVTDNGAGDNFPGSAVLGQINSGALNVGGFTIVSNISQSKPLIGSASAPQMDITFSAVTNDNLSHTIFLYASDTGFTTGGLGLLTLGGTQPGGGGNSIVGRAYGGTSNNNLDLTNVFATVGPTGATPFALSATGGGTPLTNPFSMTLGLQITRTTAGTTTGDLNLISVPEPMSLALLGTGMVAVGLMRRRRKA